MTLERLERSKRRQKGCPSSLNVNKTNLRFFFLGRVVLVLGLLDCAGEVGNGRSSRKYARYWQTKGQFLCAVQKNNTRHKPHRCARWAYRKGKPNASAGDQGSGTIRQGTLSHTGKNQVCSVCFFPNYCCAYLLTYLVNEWSTCLESKKQSIIQGNFLAICLHSKICFSF